VKDDPSAIKMEEMKQNDQSGPSQAGQLIAAVQSMEQATVHCWNTGWTIATIDEQAPLALP
jgi:hypothetical protein